MDVREYLNDRADREAKVNKALDNHREGITVDGIVEETGLTVETVRKTLDDLGLMPGLRFRFARLTVDDHQEILGLSDEALIERARELDELLNGYGQSSVSDCQAMHAIDAELERRGLDPHYPDYKDLHAELEEEERQYIAKLSRIREAAMQYIVAHGLTPGHWEEIRPGVRVYRGDRLAEIAQAIGEREFEVQRALETLPDAPKTEDAAAGD